MILDTFKTGLRLIPFHLRCINYQHNALVTSGSGKLVQSSNLTLSTPFCSHVKYVHNKKVPWTPTWQPVMKTQPSLAMEVHGEVVGKLERLALVDFGNQEGIDCLEKAIQFADQLHIVNSLAVEPLDSVLHDRSMHLRNDIVTEGKRAEELLQLSKHVIDEYFVAPPDLVTFGSGTDDIVYNDEMLSHLTQVTSHFKENEERAADLEHSK